MADLRGTAMRLPDPGTASELPELVERLRLLKVWAGDPSYEVITARINETWSAEGRRESELARRTTVADCFQPRRRRLNADLVLAVVRALHPDAGYLDQWQQAFRAVAARGEAAAQVRVQTALPTDLDHFTGRVAELSLLRQTLREGRQAGDAVVISAIAGMAGVGKTRLAVHAGHLLAAEEPFDRVLFVDLRGFHPDPGQPPADPAAVLDGFLRMLGMPGRQIPSSLGAKVAAYRRLLAGRKVLIVLDNAASEQQVTPLLPRTPGCLTIVTSRRHLDGLERASRLAVDVFSEADAIAFLAEAAVDIQVGDDPAAATRIAVLCGYLPLALGLVAGYMKSADGWTLTDHADRLDERHRDRRLESGVELALGVSYQQLPADQRRLLRLAAVHPGDDFDAYAAAALLDTDLPTVEAQLERLHRDHLLEMRAPGRYSFHDLVRAYATVRAGEEEPRTERRAAVTRLLDYYLGTTSAAMDVLYPSEAGRVPRVSPPSTPWPTLGEAGAVLGWLDAESQVLIAVASHAADHDWSAQAMRLAATLYRYVDGAQAADTVLADSGVARDEPPDAYWREAVSLFHQAGDPAGQARVLANLGVPETDAGHLALAARGLAQAIPAQRQARVELTGAGPVPARYRKGIEHLEQALALDRSLGNRAGEATVRRDLAAARAHYQAVVAKK
jgi:hypothetical protein